MMSEAARRRRGGRAVLLLFLCFIPRFLTEYDAEFETDGKMKVILVNDRGIPITGTGKVFLHIKGCANAYFILTETTKFADTSGKYYAVFLGSGNKRDVNGIKDGCFSCKEFKVAKYAQVLNCNEFRAFWVTWNDQGNIQVGLGLHVYKQSLLNYTGKQKFTVNYINILSSKFKGQWKFMSACQAGKYGRRCEQKCGLCSYGTTCEQMEGLCMNGCVPGWSGERCTTKCPTGRYGMNCSKVCGHCGENDTCDHSTGHCPADTCDPGWSGMNCDTACVDGTFGESCSQMCGRCLRGQPCDKMSGICNAGCQPGFIGQKCSMECSSGTYGYNCSSSCGNCSDDVACDHVTGSCPVSCAAGWLGSRCDVMARDVQVNVNSSSTLDAPKPPQGECLLGNLKNGGHRKELTATPVVFVIVICISFL